MRHWMALNEIDEKRISGILNESTGWEPLENIPEDRRHIVRSARMKAIEAKRKLEEAREKCLKQKPHKYKFENGKCLAVSCDTGYHVVNGVCKYPIYKMHGGYIPGVDNNLSGHVVGADYDLDKCQNICTSRDDCAAFTYNKNTNKCYLKTNNNDGNYADGDPWYSYIKPKM